MKNKFRLLMILAMLVLAIGLLGACGSDNVDLDSDINTDIDSNIDMDSDVDSDVDIDIDVDIDGDVDVDSDGDTDVDVDVDADVDETGGIIVSTAKEFTFGELESFFEFTYEDMIGVFGEPYQEFVSTTQIGVVDYTYTDLAYKDGTMISFMGEVAEDSTVYYAIIWSGNIYHTRGVHIGDSVEDVVALFAGTYDPNAEKAMIDGLEYINLYGNHEHSGSYGAVEFYDGEIAQITYADGDSVLRFLIDGGVVFAVEYINEIN